MGAFDGQEPGLLRAEPEEDGVGLLAELLDARNRRAGEDPDPQGRIWSISFSSMSGGFR